MFKLKNEGGLEMSKKSLTTIGECIPFLKKICTITTDGSILWNEPAIIDLLERLGYRSIKDNGKIRFIRIDELTAGETGFEHIKELLFYIMNTHELQQIRRHLLKVGAFFSPSILNALEEEFPNKVHDHWSEYYDTKGVLRVTANKMQYVFNKGEE
ncbi:MAG: hypothetical protein JXR54_04080 [Tannerellaceae bacterium]|nr:hypothetical protein [Tannerellaceae bacterium]